MLISNVCADKFPKDVYDSIDIYFQKTNYADWFPPEIYDKINTYLLKEEIFLLAKCSKTCYTNVGGTRVYYHKVWELRVLSNHGFDEGYKFAKKDPSFVFCGIAIMFAISLGSAILGFGGNEIYKREKAIVDRQMTLTNQENNINLAPFALLFTASLAIGVCSTLPCLAIVGGCCQLLPKKIFMNISGAYYSAKFVKSWGDDIAVPKVKRILGEFSGLKRNQCKV